MPFELIGDVGGNEAFLPPVPPGRIDFFVVAGAIEVNGLTCVIVARSPEGIVSEVAPQGIGQSVLERELPVPERYQLGVQLRGGGIPFLQMRGWWVRVTAEPQPGSTVRSRRAARS